MTRDMCGINYKVDSGPFLTHRLDIMPFQGLDVGV